MPLRRRIVFHLFYLLEDMHVNAGFQTFNVQNIVMSEDCVIINIMVMPNANLCVCILMEDGYKNFDPGCYLS